MTGVQFKPDTSLASRRCRSHPFFTYHTPLLRATTASIALLLALATDTKYQILKAIPIPDVRYTKPLFASYR
jgi:hypothetical protein